MIDRYDKEFKRAVKMVIDAGFSIEYEEGCDPSYNEGSRMFKWGDGYMIQGTDRGCTDGDFDSMYGNFMS